jgi:hypothetical protein
MSALAVQNEILEPMQRMFSPPHRHSDDLTRISAALRDYVAPLELFDAADLKAAWVEVVSNHDKTTWPVPAVIVKAAKAARKAAAEGSTKPVPGQQRRWERMTEEEKFTLWKVARATPKAAEAAQMGVAWSFKCLILGDGKDAATIDLRELRLAKNRAHANAERLRDGHNFIARNPDREVDFSDENRSKAVTMWRSQLKREVETRDEIHRYQPGDTNKQIEARTAA